MYIAVCEDEPEVRESIQRMISDWAAVRHIMVDIMLFENAERFLFSWPEQRIDLVLLDIQMKHINGMELAKIIRTTDTELMLAFITGMRQFVLTGFDVNALHYLFKPINLYEMNTMLDKAHSMYTMRNSEALLVADGEGQRKLPLDGIHYINIESHYADIHSDQGMFRLRISIAELQKRLPMQFMRCHRSYIVNLFRVDNIQNSYLEVTGGKQVPISRNCAKPLREAFLRLHT